MFNQNNDGPYDEYRAGLVGSSSSALGEYFLHNAPSQQNKPYKPEARAYFKGQEEFAANAASILAVLTIVIVVAVFLLYLCNPGLHQIVSGLHS
jgi:hypothetical protein